MTKNYIILLNHEDDAIMLEELLMEHQIFYECDVIGADELIYEFTINSKHKKIVVILLKYNKIKYLKFISN